MEFDNTDRIEIRMFRVVEGEAILLIFDQSRCWLIDGGNTGDDGPNEKLAEALHSYLLDRSLVLEACVASHAHFDHMGAYETLLKHGPPAVADPVRVIRSTPAWKDNDDFLTRYRTMVDNPSNAIDEDVINASADFRDPPVDTSEEIIPGLTARFLAGGGSDEYFSLMMQLTFGGARILFTGDTTQGYERRLIRDIKDDTAWRADVFKVSHHGSEHSNSQDLIDKAKPSFAFVSDNKTEDHRLEDTTKTRLLNTPVGKRRIFQTVNVRDIVIETDGNPYKGGTLYRVTQPTRAEFATALQLHDGQDE
jgi:competence protein ComEC